MLYLTAADALISVWDDKAHWSFWRPITAIREADTDGNPRTEPDDDWLPLIATPPYPEHPSGHTGLSGSIVKTLQQFFGTDKIAWSDTNNAGLTRSFTRFSQAIDEIVDARVWSGIHFRTADEQGERIGRQVARYREQHYFQPEHRSHREPSLDRKTRLRLAGAPAGGPPRAARPPARFGGFTRSASFGHSVVTFPRRWVSGRARQSIGAAPLAAARVAGSFRLEAECSPDQRQRLEDLVGWFGRADLVRVLAEQHRCVDGGAGVLRRQPLDLGFVDRRCMSRKNDSWRCAG